MELVVVYYVGGGYECGSQLNIHCLEYESPEAFLIHFEEKVKETLEIYDKKMREIKDYWKTYKKEPQTKNEITTRFLFATNEFDADLFREELPEVYELNEWFDKWEKEYQGVN